MTQCCAILIAIMKYHILFIFKKYAILPSIYEVDELGESEQDPKLA